MNAYIPVLILMGIGVTIAAAATILSALIGPKKPNKIKMDVYECGVPPIGDARRRFSVRFYLVAILFLLFDVESVFFYPLAIAYKKFIAVNAFILIEMLFFAAVLLIGFIYIYRKGALEWD